MKQKREKDQVPHRSRRYFLKAGAAAAVGGFAAATVAQVIPATARIIIGFPPGSSADIVARHLANQLTGKLASSVIVDSRSGAGGNIAVSTAIAAAPDGTNLLLNPSGVMTVNPHTYKKLGFSPFDDLAPVSMVCRYEIGFAVGPAVPESVKTLSEFTAWVRQQRQTVGYGSPGAGSGLHFAAHAFSSSNKLNMVHVPYRGANTMVTDMLGGQIAAGAGSLPALMAHAGGGKLRVLASTGAERSRFFPSVPTFEEQSVPGLEMREWNGIYVGAKTDAQTIARLVPLIHNAVKSPEFVEAMAKQGLEAATSTPQDLARIGQADSKRWGEIVKNSGFVLES